MKRLALLLLLGTLVGCRVEPSLGQPCAPDGTCPTGCTCIADIGQCLPDTGGSCAEAVAARDAGSDAGPLVVQAAAPPAAVQDSAYRFVFAMDGGTPPYAFQLAPDAGQPPAELVLTDAGTLEGTPSVDAGTYGFTVVVRDSATPRATLNVPVELRVRPRLELMGPLTVADAVESAPYTETLYAPGGTPPLRFSASATQPLPGQLTLSESGVISGKAPSSRTSYSFSASVEDSSTPPRRIEKTFSLTVRADPLLLGDPRGVATRAVPAALLGEPYAYTLRYVKPLGTVTWTLIAGGLPQGIGLDPTTGELSGLPSQRGPSTFSVEARDSGGTFNADTDRATFTLEVQ